MIQKINDKYKVFNDTLNFNTIVTDKNDAININDNLNKSIIFIGVLFKYCNFKKDLYYTSLKFNSYHSGLIYSITFISDDITNNKTTHLTKTIYMIYHTNIKNILNDINNNIEQLKNKLKEKKNWFNRILTYFKINNEIKSLKNDMNILLNYCYLLGVISDIPGCIKLIK